MSAPTTLPPSQSPSRPGPQESPPLRGWSRTCYEEVSTLFDTAHKGIASFVERELIPLEKSAARVLDPVMLAEDLFELGATLAERGNIRLSALPSEREISRAMARWSLGPRALDRYLQRTFGFLTATLTARCGQEEGRAAIQRAQKDFKPVRREALRRLAVGPRLLRPALGPWRYLAAPALWWGAWMIHFKARRRRLVRDAVQEALIDAELVPVIAPDLGAGLVRWFALSAACTMGAGLAQAVAFRALDVGEMYAGLLDEVEEILLMGSLSDDPSAVRFGPGLLDIIGRLDEESAKFQPQPVGSEDDRE